MKRYLSVLLGLLIAVFFIESKFTNPRTEKTLKLQGFEIAAPSLNTSAARMTHPKNPTRRSIVTSTTLKQSGNTEAQPQLTPEQKEYIRDQRIARARIEWERIRNAAVQRLHLDDDTLTQYEALRDDYFNGLDQDAKRHYEENIERLLGPERFHFLTDVREAFKQKVFERTQIEVGPLMGTL